MTILDHHTFCCEAQVLIIVCYRLLTLQDCIASLGYGAQLETSVFNRDNISLFSFTFPKLSEQTYMPHADLVHGTFAQTEQILW